jgi:misacylated tRNA(Ala) deacylase
MSNNHDPKMHTAEHLLNQAMVRKFGCKRCFSSHINKKKSKCDYHFDRALTQDDINDLQERVNQQIEEDHPVIIEMKSKAVAQKQFNLERVPDKEELDQVRIVNIGDYDACPCSGLHVNATKEIGVFKITTTGFEQGVLRIRFKLLS